jgi:hypothetical protein
MGHCDGERKGGGGVRRWGRHVEGGGGQGGLVGRDMWRGGGRGLAPAVAWHASRGAAGVGLWVVGGVAAGPA